MSYTEKIVKLVTPDDDKEFYTPFMVLNDKLLDTAKQLHFYFYDMVNDGAEFDYPKARVLYADPLRYLQHMGEKND